MSLIEPEQKIQTLTETLRDRTWALHTAAERSGIINDMLRGKADRRGYALLLRNVLPAYRAMEQALDAGRDRKIYSAFAQPSLYRSERIASDLAALHGDNWESDLPQLPEADRYAETVTQAGEGDGSRLVAHAYVRYFGDLSGGQVLKRLLSKTLGLSPEALNFYEFPEITDPAAFKQAMREAIDRDVAQSCEHEPVLREAMSAFEHNIAVSTAIQRVLAEAA
jgi:heme oxygenase